jgi:thioesterase domain-containing protein
METVRDAKPTLPIHFQLIDIWQRTLGCPIESISESFFDLGGHSLLVARLLDDIEAETDRFIPVATFLDNPTIAGCTTALLARSSTGGPITALQNGNGAIPLFFFHGDILGGGFYVRRLMPEFGADQPLYVISPPRLDPGAPLPKIEQIASERITAMKSQVSHGPYALAGFCIGGVVAYEVARQLEAQGESVKTVVMIDPEIGSHSEALCLRAVDWIGERRQMNPSEKVEHFMTAQRKLTRLRQVKKSPLKEKRDFLVNSIRKLRGNGETPSPSSPETSTADDSQNGNVLDAFQWLATAYRPPRYEGRVKLLYTAEQLEATPHLLREWRKAAPNLRTKRIIGRHLTAITTHGAAIVAAIRAELKMIQMLSFGLCEMLVMV